MARISTYIKDDNITRDDFVIGSDGDNNQRTSQFSVGALADFIASGIELDEIDSLPEGTGLVHTEEIHYAPDFDTNALFYTGGYDPNAMEVVFPKFPVINIEHNLGTRNIIVFLLEEATVTTPQTVWVNDEDGVLQTQAVTDLNPTSRLVESILSDVIVLDNNTVQIDLGQVREIVARVVVIGPNTDSE